MAIRRKEESLIVAPVDVRGAGNTITYSSDQLPERRIVVPDHIRRDR